MTSVCCLGGMCRAEMRKSFTQGAFTSDEQIFVVRNPSIVSSLMLGSLENGMDEEVWLLPKDVPLISVFFGVQNEGLTDVEGSDQLDLNLLCFFFKIVMNFLYYTR